MIKFEGIAAFVATADAGSISEASRRLGLPKSVVSERLAELERVLGAKLIHRTTRKLVLTEEGTVFLERGRRMYRDMVEAAADIAERRGSLAGPLRISAPVSFGTLHLGRALYSFLSDNPNLELTLELDDRFVDVAADGYDASIRHGVMRDSRLIAKRLASSRRLLVAAPSYLAKHGVPTSVSDLERYNGILYANRDADWRFKDGDEWTSVRPRTSLRVNNGMIMRDAALAGLGMTLLPTFMIAAEIANRSLHIVDIGAEAEGAELYIAYPKDRTQSAKLKSLTEHLRRTFGDPPYWDAQTAHP
jgi:DNA-binding transcriptional LysR family regulator